MDRYVTARRRLEEAEAEVHEVPASIPGGGRGVVVYYYAGYWDRDATIFIHFGLIADPDTHACNSF